jgi:CDP-4-dehydro-6-deoxyglucose reductase, E1
LSDITKLLENINLDKTDDIKKIRKQIMELVSEYYKLAHNQNEFILNQSTIPVSGKVFSEIDLQMLVSSSLDFWLTSGRFNNEFEKQLAHFLNVNFVLTTNSGSSANLLALTTLTSEQLGERALKPGDEVITVAAGFPTTVNPILQNNLKPVFVDVNIPTYEIDSSLIENAISEKTKAIMIAHTLGNAFDLDEVTKIAKKYNLWLIEDCCDALGTTYDGKLVGTFGDIATISFYPAHHITTGEGGAVFTNNAQLKKIIESFRDWGRDCFCATGMSDTCGKRFCWELGELPKGYDHKYTYSHIGYNLKITDMQAAVGLAQLQNLPSFIEKRKKNFEFLKTRMSKFEKFFILPEATPKSDPAWFGFPITVRKDAPFSKTELLQFLTERKVDTRPLFAGNITKQPYFKNIDYRISGSLKNTDEIMNQSFWIGVYPGLNKDMQEYIINQFEEFIKKYV